MIVALAILAAWGGPARGDAAPAFDQQRAFAHLAAQCAFGPRVPGTQGHEQCAQYIERILEEAGGAVSVTPFAVPTDARPDTVGMVNLSARFGGPGAPLLIGAHWDTRPWADQDPDSTRRDQPILGANDGASGAAVLLALAELFSKRPPPIPVRLVFFDGEDQGREGNLDGYCLGARFEAGRLAPPWPRAVIVVDLVGGRDLHVCREEASEQYAGQLNRLIFGRAAELGLAGFEDRVCVSVYDDHVPFLERGIPAVDIVDMHFPEWHTLADTPRNCSPESLGQVGRLLVDLVFGGWLQ